LADMKDKQFWLVVFSEETWIEFIDAGAQVMGFNERQKHRAQDIKQGDWLLCYVMRLGRFIGALEVKSELYTDRRRIWWKNIYQYRLKVTPVIAIELENAVPVTDVKNKLLLIQSVYEANLKKWSAHFRNSPSKWVTADGETVIKALEDAKMKQQNRSFSKTP
jgi:predicted RNA-binding protein